jgi:hypothetical protein
MPRKTYADTFFILYRYKSDCLSKNYFNSRSPGFVIESMIRRLEYPLLGFDIHTGTGWLYTYPSSVYFKNFDYIAFALESELVFFS